MTVVPTLITRGDAAHTFGPPERLETVETDTAMLFFLGDLVYKLKKPVRFGSVDFTTREARLAACEAEVRLNRRLAPDIYLGVADIRDDHGQLRDHMVVMRRLPARQRLSTLIRQHDSIDEPIQELARQLANFHERCDTRPEIARAGGQANLEARWLATLERVTPYRDVVLQPAVLDEIRSLALDYLAGRGPLLADRARAGRIRDGHGDLNADDIYFLPDGPRVLDSVDYDQQPRVSDVLGDVASLAMDLERLGAPEAAARFLTCYREFSGETYPPSLQHLYIAYRALERAEAACIRHDQGDPDAAEEAGRLTNIALAHLRRVRVRLVLAGGGPGTSTQAEQVTADEDGLVLLRFRRVLADLADGITPAGCTTGEAEPLTSDQVHHELLRRARHALEHGHNVVMDAAWTDRRQRELAAELAKSVHADLVEPCCE
jgi:aminoglycoside phosphotransferase family enzyme